MNRRFEVPAPNQPLQMVQREIPTAPARGAVVKLHYAGICHSDLNMWKDRIDLGGGKIVNRSKIAKVTFPMVLGHESSGEIYELGSDVDTAALGMKVGDLVMVFPWGGCQNCYYCKEERYNCCRKRGDNILGYNFPGGFEEYMAVPDVAYLLRTPDGVPMDVAALLPCSGITAYNAITGVLPSLEEYRTAYGPGALLIVGAGGLGLWAIQIAKLIMPEGTQIIVAEAFESKFDDARKAGADKTLLWPIDATVDANVAACKELAPDGVAGAVDFVGAPNTTSSTYGCLAPMTTMVAVGLYGGQMATPIPTLVYGQHNVTGKVVGDPGHLRKMAKLVAEGKILPPPITHVKLEEAERVLREMDAGTVRGRNVIKHV